MFLDDDKLHGRRLVVWLVVTVCVLAELVGLGLVRAHGANALETPVISAVGLPHDPTPERSASFMFTNSRTVAFRCALDAESPTACGLGVFGTRTYAGPLADGSHTFRVWAVAGSETSEPASYTWLVADDDSGVTSGIGNGSGSGGGSGTGTQTFDISGDVDGLVPGVTRTIGLTLHNPNAAPIYVTEVTVEIADESTPPGCPSDPNITLRQPTGITSSSPVLVPGHESVVLATPPRAPTISFVNQPWNQDVCQGKSFELAYTGSAHS